MNHTPYLTFARKYRPINFLELQGQEALVKILSYAIINNRLAQGYLLTGMRGVGKTTSARIIAKTINCMQPKIEGENISPCEKCQNCQSFNDNKHPDILEIDAASRTSVDDMRSLIESSEYRPLLGKYKVFIIDEVHMLSKSAFNALLKVLEEPPLHIVFIFATTEVHKIPLTIISRCQRYDLRRLRFNEILKIIKQIVEKENLSFEDEALRVITFKSEGSARDAVAMLDQAVNLTKEESDRITADMINQMLGAVPVNTIIEFFQYIVARNADSAIETVHRIYAASGDLEDFIKSVSDFIAYLSKVKILTNYHNPIYDSNGYRITDILIQVSLDKLSIFWQIFSKGVQEIKISHNQLVTTEMLVIKAIYSVMLPSLEELTSSTIIEEKNDNTEKTAASSNPAKGDVSAKITDFLKFLHIKNEMEIYYLLLNQVEMKNFANNIMELAGKNISSKLKEQIGNLLFAWTGKQWNVIITHQQEILPLKEQLINKVQSEDNWQTIKEYFPRASISDILLKN